MQKLIFNKRQHVSLYKQIKIGNIPEMLLYDRLRDGRIIGLLIEDIIANEFSGITRVVGNGCAHDLVKTDCKIPIRLQCKSYKNNKLSITPSYMVGSGRKYDYDGMISYLDNIDAFVFIKIDDFPELEIITVKTSDLILIGDVNQNYAKLTHKQLITFIDKL